MAATPSSESALADFVAIPSVSSDRARTGDMRRAAGWVAKQLSFARARVVETSGHPVVLAAIERHVAAPRGVEVRIEARPGAVPAYVIGVDHPAVHAAQDALREVYPGQEPLLVRIGGTLPAAAMFERVLGLKTLLFSFSTADENLHAPNEFFRLDRLREGVAAWSELWRRLGAISL